jgi:hypothetical protein
MAELCWWVREWLQLNHALYIGPAALLGAADDHARLVAKTGPSLDAEQRIAEARSFLQHVINEGSSVPRTSEVHAAAKAKELEIYTV